MSKTNLTLAQVESRRKDVWELLQRGHRLSTDELRKVRAEYDQLLDLTNKLGGK